MKTIEEIKKLTQMTVKAQKKAKREAEKKAKELEKKRRKETIEYYRNSVQTFFPEEIEKEAKKGKNTYSINLSANYKTDSKTRLEVAYIKKYLKDFNPTFTEEETYTYETNWEGGEIDGTRRHYTVTRVNFSW
jgi:hypothetical protein